jgi:hypothetical protein
MQKTKINEIAGTFGIVSCKDKNNPNFQVWGAMSDLKCKRKKAPLKMKFKDWVEYKHGK